MTLLTPQLFRFWPPEPWKNKFDVFQSTFVVIFNDNPKNSRPIYDFQNSLQKAGMETEHTSALTKVINDKFTANIILSGGNWKHFL